MHAPPIPLTARSYVRAYTLMELLLAVALICTVIAIALPVFGTIRSASKQTKCQSRLRHLGGALALYLNEHNHVLPPVAEVHDKLARYLGINEVLTSPHLHEANVAPLLCPSDREPTRSAYRSYAANFYLGEVTNPSVQNVRRMSEVARPSATVFMIDGYRKSSHPTHQARVALGTYGFGGAAGAEFGVRYDHQRRANVLFADGHLETVQQEETERRAQELLFPKYQP